MKVWISISEKAFDSARLRKILDFDIRGVRINLSRETYEWSLWAIQTLVAAGYPPGGIFLDIGNNKPRLIIKNSEDFQFEANEVIQISGGESKTIRVSVNEHVFAEIEEGHNLIIGDGQFVFNVIEKTKESLHIRAAAAGTLKNFTSISVGGKDISFFGINHAEADFIEQILEAHPVQLIISFVQETENIEEAIRRFPKANGIIPKIETVQAYQNIEAIVKLSSAILIGRGDLGLAMGIEKIGFIQEDILKTAKKHGTSVVVATETMESMNHKPFPYRSEIIDITNSFFKEVDAILLTSETAGAKEPFNAISFLLKTIDFLKLNKT